MIEQDSRYATCILYVDGDQEFLGARQPIDTSPRADDQFHPVVEGDRVDLLSYRYLGRAELWWVICDYNEIAFPLELELGVILRIPSRETVQMKVLG